MIRVQNLTKRFGSQTAVDNLSFGVERGEILGFLGANGAGKTTTMRILAGFIPATGGTVSIDGLDVFTHSLEVRRRIGYLPENVPLYGDMRVSEYLRYRGRLKGLGGRRLRHRVAAVIEACGLSDVQRLLIGRLSKGYRQRVGLADSFVHEPPVLILDEPTIGLDPHQIRLVRELIKGFKGQHTVLLSSHILPEIESVCDRVLIIDRGRFVAADSPSNLVGGLTSSARVVAEIAGPMEAVRDALLKISNHVDVTPSHEGEWHTYSCACEHDAQVRAEIFTLVGARGWGLRELRTDRRGLEDVFVAVTGANAAQTGPAIEEAPR